MDTIFVFKVMATAGGLLNFHLYKDEAVVRLEQMYPLYVLQPRTGSHASRLMLLDLSLSYFSSAYIVLQISQIEF